MSDDKKKRDWTFGLGSWSKRVTGSSVKSFDDWIEKKVPWPWLAKRVVGYGLLIFLAMLLLNWFGLPVGFWHLLLYIIFAMLLVGLWYPQIVLRPLFAKAKQAWIEKTARLVVRVLSFGILGIWMQSSFVYEYVGLSIFFALPIIRIFIWKGLGEWVKKVIPGTWDDVYVDKAVDVTKRQIPWVMATIIGLLVFPLVFLVHVREFTIVDADPQTATIQYKIYTDLGVEKDEDDGQVLVNNRDFRFWKWDPAGFQGTMIRNKGKKVKAVTIGFHWPSKDLYENAVVLLEVYPDTESPPAESTTTNQSQ